MRKERPLQIRVNQHSEQGISEAEVVTPTLVEASARARVCLTTSKPVNPQCFLLHVERC